MCRVLDYSERAMLCRRPSSVPRSLSRTHHTRRKLGVNCIVAADKGSGHRGGSARLRRCTAVQSILTGGHSRRTGTGTGRTAQRNTMLRKCDVKVA